MIRALRLPFAILVALALLAAAAPRAGAAPRVPERLKWQPCDEGFECATAHVPRDYTHPGGAQLELALIRKPASDREHRIGSLFMNPGGPGGSGVNLVRFAPPGAVARFSRRYDLVGFDPRGVSASTPAVRDCSPTYGTRFIRPETLDRAALRARAQDHLRRCLAANGSLLPSLTTGNVARDLDHLRAAVGDAKLNFLGFSYAGVIGETYTTLFPGRTGALVLDSPVDGEAWIKQPLEGAREQEASFERSLGRFARWCSLQAPGCPLGAADDPIDDFDALVERLNAAPLADGVIGDDVLIAAEETLYSRFGWQPLADALAAAAAGDGAGVRQLAGGNAGELASAYPAYMLNEGRYPRRFEPFLRANEHAFAMSPHFWWVRGYEWAGVTLYPLRPRGAYRGPFSHAPRARPALVIGGLHDPAAPYVWAKRLTADLGNARLLTYRSDGHGAITDLNPCIVGNVLAYLEDDQLPPEGASCTQETPDAAERLAAGEDAGRERWKRIVR